MVRFFNTEDIWFLPPKLGSITVLFSWVVVRNYMNNPNNALNPGQNLNIVHHGSLFKIRGSRLRMTKYCKSSPQASIVPEKEA